MDRGTSALLTPPTHRRHQARRRPGPGVDRGAVAVACTALVLVACTGPAVPRLQVDPLAAPMVAPVEMVLTGVEPGSTVEMTAEVEVSASGLGWRSEATYTADEDGRVDLATATPDEAAYADPDSTGLLWTLAPEDGHEPTEQEMTWWFQDHVIRITAAVDGAEVATADLERIGILDSAGMPKAGLWEEVTDNGIVGAWAVPDSWDPAADPNDLSPAVLAFGGSECGLFTGALDAWMLALGGYPALGISYFGREGQPTTLTDVPIETFLTALEWLRSQPGVDPDRIFTFGVSRGGEVALWLAAHRPELVYGAIAPVGVHALMSGLPPGTSSAWTLDGEALPAAPRLFSSEYPEGELDETSAWIPVEEIRGPVVLACGGHDELWNSCIYAHAAAARLDRLRPGQHVLIDEPEATHAVASPPTLPYFLSAGSGAQATHRARLALWAAVKDALAQADR